MADKTFCKQKLISEHIKNAINSVTSPTCKFELSMHTLIQ